MVLGSLHRYLDNPKAITLLRLFTRMAISNIITFLWILYFLYISNIFHALPGYNLGINYSWTNFFYLSPLISIYSIFISYRIENIADLMFLSSVLIYWFPLLYLLSKQLEVFVLFAINLLFTIITWNFLKKRLKTFQHPRGLEISFQFRLTFWIFLITYILLFFASFGFKTGISYVSSLYEVRTEYKEAGYSYLQGLLMMLSEYMMLPIILFFFFNTNRLMKLITFLFIALLSSQIFFHTAIKSSLFLVPYLILLYLFFSENKNYLVIVILLISMIFLFNQQIFFFFFNHMLRRFIVSPAINAYYYIDYFTKNYRLVNYGVGPLGGLVARTYYYVDGNATTGLVADCLGRGGTILFISFPILYSIILSIIKYVSSFLPLKYQVILFGGYIYVFLNASILTTMWSYGLIGIIAFTFILKYQLRSIKKWISLKRV